MALGRAHAPPRHDETGTVSSMHANVLLNYNWKTKVKEIGFVGNFVVASGTH